MFLALLGDAILCDVLCSSGIYQGWSIVYHGINCNEDVNHVYNPIASMYGIFTYIWLICMINVGKYTSPMDVFIMYMLEVAVHLFEFFDDPFLPRYFLALPGFVTPCVDRPPMLFPV